MGHETSVRHWCDTQFCLGTWRRAARNCHRSLFSARIRFREWEPRDVVLEQPLYCLIGSCILAHSHLVHECSDGELVAEVVYERNEGGRNYCFERFLAGGSNGDYRARRVSCTEESGEDGDCLDRHIARKI